MRKDDSHLVIPRFISNNEISIDHVSYSVSGYYYESISYTSLGELHNSYLSEEPKEFAAYKPRHHIVD